MSCLVFCDRSSVIYSIMFQEGNLTYVCFSACPLAVWGIVFIFLTLVKYQWGRHLLAMKVGNNSGHVQHSSDVSLPGEISFECKSITITSIFPA